MSGSQLHRNGESLPPEIPGNYEFCGKRYCHHLGAKNVKVLVVRSLGGGLCVMEDYEVDFAYYEGRWWGPYPD